MTRTAKPPSRMITALSTIAVLAVMVWGCRGNTTEDPAPTVPLSMKGYELYSWYEGTGWSYSLVVGTNRVKTFAEIAAPEVRLGGFEALKEKLATLSDGEQVLWSAGRVPGTTLPSAQTVDDLRAICDRSGIGLVIVD